ncbi:HigA family addiction module antitoxin [Tabrizicola aquatica]|uniref:HigA family addiction module antitoxin n=1 Tax=Tabrizicola aquatica TaxID=909926 RepID=UPI000CD1F956|nr:HigA family addiction module antitoxin [Tabrizicola aquatica]
MNNARSVHPGIVLKDELAALRISPTEFSRQIDVPSNRISQIIAGKRSITGDTALRLGHWFETDPHFWLSLQAQFELAEAEQEHGEAISHLPTRVNLPSPPRQLGVFKKASIYEHPTALSESIPTQVDASRS